LASGELSFRYTDWSGENRIEPHQFSSLTGFGTKWPILSLNVCQRSMLFELQPQYSIRKIFSEKSGKMRRLANILSFEKKND